MAVAVGKGGPPPDVRFYNNYYWILRFSKLYERAHGPDDGVDQQVFQVLEEVEHDPDWDVVQQLTARLPGPAGQRLTDRLERKLQSGAQARQPLTWEQRKALLPRFEADIRLLESLTGDDFSDWLAPRGFADGRVIFYGESLGSGVATQMAMERKAAAEPDDGAALRPDQVLGGDADGPAEP